MFHYEWINAINGKVKVKVNYDGHTIVVDFQELLSVLKHDGDEEVYDMTWNDVADELGIEVTEEEE